MLIDNRLFLRDKFPELRKYFLEYEGKLELHNIDVIDSKSGSKTIRYKSEDGKGLMVHSMYDPLQEAERIISSHQDKIKEDTHVFFYGVGMGYHVERFQELYPNNTYSLYEPIPEIFYEMTNHKLLETIITRNTRKLYIDIDNHNPEYYLDDFNMVKDIQLIFLPSYEDIVKEKISQFSNLIKEVVRNRRSSLHTNVNFQKLWTLNSFMNFQEVLQTPNIMRDIDHSEFYGKPALLVSAGPSLAEDIEYIKYIKENNLAYIFSVGSAINSLIAHNVLPDAVCTYAPSDNNFKVFQKMYDKNIDNIPMIFGSSVGYETIKKYRGPKVNFITTQDIASRYFLGAQIKKNHYINDAPSIAVIMVQILSEIGFSPIIFAGQNLAYKNDELYSKGIGYDHLKRGFNKSVIKDGISIKDVNGNDIKSSKSFNDMRNAIEFYINKYKDSKFINTTKGGAEIKGAPYISIETLLEDSLKSPIEKIHWWNESSSFDENELSKKHKKLTDSFNKYNLLISNLNKTIHSLSSNIRIRNIHNLKQSLIQFESLYSQLFLNEYFAEILSFYIRVNLEIVVKKVEQLNLEKDLYKKGEGIVNHFSKFMVHCNQAGNELEQIIENSMKRLD